VIRFFITNFISFFYEDLFLKLIIDIFNRFERGSILGSINIPFTSVQLSQTHIDTLGPHAKPLTDNKSSIVVIIGPHDQNNALVSDHTRIFFYVKYFFFNISSYSLQIF